MLVKLVLEDTFRKTNIASENRPSQKESSLKSTYAASTKQDWFSRCVALSSRYVALCFTLALLGWCFFNTATYDSNRCLAQCFASVWSTAFKAEYRCDVQCFALWESMFNTAFIDPHDVLQALCHFLTVVTLFSSWCGLTLLLTIVGLGLCHQWRRTRFRARAAWIEEIQFEQA